MYAPQSSIDPSLAALLQTAKMVTPDGDDTVAAQVAQAAQQKLSPPTTPPGIGALMPGVRQQAVNAAQAAQPVTQAQVQQMMQQAGARSPSQGVAGLPADNMRTFTAAQGGVVGYAGKEGSYVDPQFPSVYENYVEPTREARTGREEDELFGPMKSERQRVIEAVAEELLGPMTKERLAAAPPRPAPANRPSAPAPRPSTPPAARPPTPATRPPAAPAAGIAQLVEPTQDRSKVDPAGAPFLDEAKKQADALRKIAADREVAIKGMPDLNEQGIAALKRAEEERRRLLGIDQSDDSRRRWAGIFRGWGGDRDAYDRILTGIANRDAAANQAQLNFDQAQLKLREAQQAKALGQFDRAEKLEAEVAELYDKANKSKLQAQQIEATLASNKYATEANLYGTKVSARERAADRAQQAMIEGARLKQQAEMNGQTKLANQINAANITVSSAIERMDRDLEKRFGPTIKMFQMMPPEEIQKNPALAASYQQYQRERDNIYKTAVEPAINERNRLAAMISGGGSNVQRYDAKGNPIK